MSRLRFRALITLDPPGPGPGAAPRLPGEEYPSHTRALVLRVPSPRVPGCTRSFPAEIWWDGGQPLHPGDRAVVTIAVNDDEARECLDAGRRFGLWCAGDIGRGVISRRVYTDHPPS
jgi:hypothetical protein